MPNNWTDAVGLQAVWNFDSLVAGNSILADASSTFDFLGWYDPWKAFAGENSGWRTADGNTTGWLRISWGAGFEHVVNKYIINEVWSTTTLAPKDWTFEGYDGSSWHVLDTQTDYTDWVWLEDRTFSFVNSTAYQAYRINITENNGHASQLGVANLRLYDNDYLILPLMARNEYLAGVSPDSKNSNDLHCADAASLLTLDTTHFKQGTSSITLQRTNRDYCYRPDPKLSTTWPLKGGTANYSLSATCWIRPSDVSTLWHWVWTKDYIFDGSWHGTGLLLLGDELRFYVHFAGAYRELVSSAHLEADHWYFAAVTFDVTTGLARLYIWDDEAGTLKANVAADWSADGNPVAGYGDWFVGTCPFINDLVDVTYPGRLDEMTVWNRALSVAEIQDIRAGTYAPPAKAINPSPADDATDVVITASLGWDDGGGATSYDVYWGTTSGALTLVSSGQAGTSWDPPGNLEYGEIYYWRIDSKNAYGTTTGDEWSFTTVASAIVADVPPFFLPFTAIWPVHERLAFHTVVLTSADGSQQRIAHRAGIPVQFFTQQLLARTEAQSVELMNLLHASLKQQQSIPIWPEAEYRTAPLTAGATSIAIDTRYADFRAAGHAAVYSSPELAEVVDVDTVAEGSLTLSAGLQNDYPAPQFIMPCRTGYIVASVPRRRFGGGASLVGVTYAITDNIAITGYAAALTYDGYEVLTEPAWLTGKSFREQHDADFTLIDAGIGAFKIVSVSDFNVSTQDHGWKNDSKAKAWAFRQWLHSVVGRQKAFLVPTFRPDFILSRPCGATDTRIYVTNRGYYQHMGGLNALRTYLAFRPVGATIIPRKITGIAAQSATEESIDLNTAPGTAFAAGRELCWVDRCTLASDEIEIEWHRRGKNLCETQLVRVAQ